MSSDDSTPRNSVEWRFYGRRSGPGLRPSKRLLLENNLPDYAIPLPPDGEVADLSSCFGHAPQWLGLEIGFGKGEHLAAVAQAAPGRDFIGAEPFANGLAAMIAGILEHGLRNIRLFGDDARLLIDRLPDASVDIVWLLHPDPWPKRRHSKRRFVNDTNLDALARILKDDGELQIATDSELYKQWTVVHMSRREDFICKARSATDWQTPPPDWHETRYASKAQREGRTDSWFRYRRLRRS